MTDNEIIKALECCVKTEFISDCAKCEMLAFDCKDTLIEYALDLINRKNAEIERLEQIVEQQDKEILTLQKRIINWRADIDYRPEDIKSEAIKEFAERLKERADSGFWQEHSYVDVDDIDNLVKEMTEVQDEND